MANSSNKYCDVATATGQANTQIHPSINTDWNTATATNQMKCSYKSTNPS